MRLMSLIAILLLLASCKKESVTRTMLNAGDSEQVTSNGFMNLMEGSIFTPRVRQIDLNKDGKLDVEIRSEWFAYNSNLSPSVSIETLHNDIAIRSKNREVNYFRFHSNNFQISAQGQYEYFNTVRISCNQESSLYFPFETVTKMTIDPLLKGESFSIVDDYNTGKFYLAEPDSGAYEATFVQDTTFFSFLEIRNDCGIFPQNQIRYVCFKLNTLQGPRLGWIELNYLGENRLRLRDWVIQH